MGIVRNGAPRELILGIRDALRARTFVETGTSIGNTASWAAEHFERVFTVEADPSLHERAKGAHGHFDNIEFLLGDSRGVLARMVSDLSAPAIFWLDGHFSGQGTAGEGDECPLLDELAAVRSSPVHHAIFIDDARLFECPPPPPCNPDDWPTIDQVIDGVRQADVERHITIVEDVIAAVPVEAADVLAAYSREAAIRTWAAAQPKPPFTTNLRTRLAIAKQAMVSGIGRR